MPYLLPFLKFVIGHIARYAPSYKFQNKKNTGQNWSTYFFTIT